MSSAQPTASIPQLPDTSPDHLVEAKRKRNIVVGSVVGGIVVLVVAAVLVYVLVFHPRVYYGNHVMITTLQKPGSCTTSSMSHDAKTPLPLSYNCSALATPQTPQHFMQSAPMSRFTLVNRTTTPNDIASCDQNSQVMCMLVSAKLERQGLIHEQQSFMVWEPLANMYLYLNDCSRYNDLDSNVCTASGMGKHFNICEVYTPPKPNSKSICTLNGRPKDVSPQLVFRPLPKDFQKLMADTKTNPYMKGFLFHFESTKPTNNMLTIKTNYLMRSDLSNDVVHFNVVTGNIDVIDDKKKTITDPNDKTKVDESFYWQIIK
jgi:hypothetical protein